MYYDIPKIPQTGFYQVAREDIPNNNPFHVPSHNSEGLGGLFIPITSSGTASGVSTSTVPYETLIFIPESGPIPGEDVRIHHEAKVMELKSEISDRD